MTDESKVWRVRKQDGTWWEVFCVPACGLEEMKRTYPDATDIQPAKMPDDK